MLTVSWPKCTVRYRALVCVLCSTAMCLCIATEGSVYWRLGGWGMGVRVGMGTRGRGKLGGAPCAASFSRCLLRSCVAGLDGLRKTLTLETDPNPHIISRLGPTALAQCRSVAIHHVHVQSHLHPQHQVPTSHPPPHRIHIATSVSTHTSIGPSETGRTGPAAQLPWLFRSYFETKPTD